MREILFRGKNAYGRSDWVYGSYLPKSKTICTEELKQGTTLYADIFVNPDTVGQYTGLTDGNGKKIFEGDIVKFAKNIYQVIFEVGSFALYDQQGEMISKIGGFNDNCYSLMDLYIECCWEDEWASDVEVIGNIHDNPELQE